MKDSVKSSNSGTATPPRKAPTSWDVARLARVSQKTVSRVLNREPSVSRTTRERVLQAIGELGYRPNMAARSLGAAKAYALGLAYSNPNPYYIVALQDGALRACNELGYELQIHPTDIDDKLFVQKFGDLVYQTRLAGVVVAPPMSERTSLLRGLSAAHIPFVRIISAARDPGDGHPSVYVNDCGAAYAITEHLLQLGHTRIGFLWGRKAFSSSVQRYNGYAAAMRAYGVPVRKELVVPGDYSFSDGFRGARHLLRLARPPTAIFGSNDEIAAGVLAAARAASLRVPQDISVAGFEDSPFSQYSWPALTTARQHMDIIAEQAVDSLVALIAGQNANGRIFTPELIIRASSAPPATSAKGNPLTTHRHVRASDTVAMPRRPRHTE